MEKLITTPKSMMTIYRFQTQESGSREAQKFKGPVARLGLFHLRNAKYRMPIDLTRHQVCFDRYRYAPCELNGLDCRQCPNSTPSQAQSGTAGQ